MKGVRYLIDDEGKKTHAVLELDVWGDALNTLLAEPSVSEARQLGFLNKFLLEAGYTEEQLEEMNRASAEEALRPLTLQELGLDDG